jgi:hypothetical protein
MMLSLVQHLALNFLQSGLIAERTKVPPLRVELRCLLSRVALWAADLVHRACYAGAQPGADRPSGIACAQMLQALTVGRTWTLRLVDIND